jgi:hypothetical protein
MSWGVLNITMIKSYQVDLYKKTVAKERMLSQQLLESVAKLHTVAKLVEDELEDLELAREIRLIADRLNKAF